MTDSIFLIQGDSDAEPVELHEHQYISEDRLQELIANHPDILAGDQMDPGSPRRWLLVEREQGVPDRSDGANRWSLDHLFLDQDAVPTLIEVKRSSDTRIRREVVGQMLDYAANAVVYWPVNEIRARFNARCEINGESPDELVAELLQADIDEENVSEKFWQSVKTNLQAGRVRLIFAADTIPNELRRIIEFMNVQMDPAEVLGIELKQFRDASGSFRILVPKVSGLTAASDRKNRKSTSSTKQPISRDEFLAGAREACSDAGYNTVQAIMKWSDDRGFDANVAQGKNSTSFIPAIPIAGKVKYPLSLWTDQLWIQMKHLKRVAPFDQPEQREELRKQFSVVPGWKMRDSGMTGYPSVLINEIETDKDRQRLIDAMDWLLKMLFESAKE